MSHNRFDSAHKITVLRNYSTALGGMMVSVFGGFSLQAVFIGFSRLHSGFLKTISIKRLFFSVLLILI
jgi:hypothetical protein